MAAGEQVRAHDVPPISGDDPEQACSGYMAEFAQAVWRKSSWSTFNGNCVEAACLRAGTIGVRDTRDGGSGPVLVFSGPAWRSFVAGLKAGRSAG